MRRSCVNRNSGSLSDCAVARTAQVLSPSLSPYFTASFFNLDQTILQTQAACGACAPSPKPALYHGDVCAACRRCRWPSPFQWLSGASRIDQTALAPLESSISMHVWTLVSWQPRKLQSAEHFLAETTHVVIQTAPKAKAH
jgi:hypothetical protein